MRNVLRPLDPTITDDVLFRHLGLRVPPDLLAEFCREPGVVPGRVGDVWRLFTSAYEWHERPLHRLALDVLDPSPSGTDVLISGVMRVDYTFRPFHGRGPTVDDAVHDAFWSIGFPVVVVDQVSTSDAQARSGSDHVDLVCCELPGRAAQWGLGRDSSAAASRTDAVAGAINRAYCTGQGPVHSRYHLEA